MVGDVVLGVPALKLLESNGWQPQLYGKAWASALLAGEGWTCTSRAGTLTARIGQLKELRQQSLRTDPAFDRRINTLVMPNSFSSAFEARWAGLRPAGYARDGRSLLLRQAWPPNATPEHALEGFWNLACRLTGHEGPPPQSISLRVRQVDQDKADTLLSTNGLAFGFICIVPYAGGDVDGQDKRWPAFPELTRALSLRGSPPLVTCPGPNEAQIAAALHPAAHSLPNLDLGTYLGVLRRAKVVIANDTGPAHMAAAVGTPVLSVLGPTKPEQWRPWGPANRIVKGSNHLWPSVEEVLQQAAQWL